MRVAIADYGAGNVRSVELAFRRLGAEVGGALADADLAVLPGVGAARSAMLGLGAAADELRERMDAGRPVLGICLGLQLALDETEEDGGVAGLGLLRGCAVRMREGRVPRLGWASVGEETYYFAHAYAAETPAATVWSEGVVAEARAGAFLGCQFHPEKSGAAGARYLQGVLAWAEELCLSRA